VLQTYRHNVRQWKSEHHSFFSSLSENRKPVLITALAAALLMTAGVTGGAAVFAKNGTAFLRDPAWFDGSVELLNPGRPLMPATLGSFLNLQEEPADQRDRTTVPRQSPVATLQDNWDIRELTDPELARMNGNVVGLRMTTAGYEGEALRLRWTLVSLDVDGPRPDPFFTNQPAFPTSVLMPRTNSSVNEIKIWIPVPPQPGQYALTFSLTQDNGPAIDTLTTRIEEPMPVQLPEQEAPALTGLRALLGVTFAI